MNPSGPHRYACSTFSGASSGASTPWTHIRVDLSQCSGSSPSNSSRSVLVSSAGDACDDEVTPRKPQGVPAEDAARTCSRMLTLLPVTKAKSRAARFATRWGVAPAGARAGAKGSSTALVARKVSVQQALQRPVRTSVSRLLAQPQCRAPVPATRPSAPSSAVSTPRTRCHWRDSKPPGGRRRLRESGNAPPRAQRSHLQRVEQVSPDRLKPAAARQRSFRIRAKVHS